MRQSGERTATQGLARECGRMIGPGTAEAMAAQFSEYIVRAYANFPLVRIELSHGTGTMTATPYDRPSENTM